MLLCNVYFDGTDLEKSHDVISINNSCMHLLTAYLVQGLREPGGFLRIHHALGRGRTGEDASPS